MESRSETHKMSSLKQNLFFAKTNKNLAFSSQKKACGLIPTTTLLSEVTHGVHQNQGRAGSWKQSLGSVPGRKPEPRWGLNLRTWTLQALLFLHALCIQLVSK